MSKLFTYEQESFIKNHAKGLHNKELTQLFNDTFNADIKVNQIRGYKQRNNIDSGLTGTFQKGHRPHNKGKNINDYMSNKAIEKNRATQFKKGKRPPMWLPIGSERMSKNGYEEVKVSDGQGNNNYRPKSHIIWEEFNKDKVNPNEIVVYLDKNKSNLNPDNLVKITWSDLMIMNTQGLWTKYSEINETAINVARLKSKISERKKG